MRVTTIQVTCDICGQDCENDHMDVKIGWQGKEYYLDLCDEHWSLTDQTMKGIVKCGISLSERQLLHKRIQKVK